MYFVSGDHCIFELVDPATKAPVALADGAGGGMAWPFLDWRGGPFLRYAMGDIAEVFPLRLRIEHGRDVAASELAALAGRLRARLRETLRISVEIEWLPPGTLPRQSHKTRLVEIAGSGHTSSPGKRIIPGEVLK